MKTAILLALAFISISAPGAFGARSLLQTGTTVRWFEPSNGRLNDVSVPVGGSLTFEWTSTHDLWEVPSRSCPAQFTNGSGITQIAPQSNGGEATVEFSSAGIRYFACSVGDHCEDGQLIGVNVGGAPAPAPGPSGRYRGGSSSNYGSDGQPISNYGGSNYGEEEEEEEEEESGSGYGGGGGSSYGSSGGSSYGSGR